MISETGHNLPICQHHHTLQYFSTWYFQDSLASNYVASVRNGSLFWSWQGMIFKIFGCGDLASTSSRHMVRQLCLSSSCSTLVSMAYSCCISIGNYSQHKVSVQRSGQAAIIRSAIDTKVSIVGQLCHYGRIAIIGMRVDLILVMVRDSRRK